MRDRYLPAFIMLVAGAITSIINIINKVEVTTALKRLLIVIIIFYILGLIARTVIRKVLTKKPMINADAEPEDQSEETAAEDM